MALTTPGKLILNQDKGFRPSKSYYEMWCKKVSCLVMVYNFSVLTFALTYLFVGVAYRRIIEGKVGYDQIPHLKFWQNFGSLQAVSTSLLVYTNKCY